MRDRRRRESSGDPRTAVDRLLAKLMKLKARTESDMVVRAQADPATLTAKLDVQFVSDTIFLSLGIRNHDTSRACRSRDVSLTAERAGSRVRGTGAGA
jgi:hypothetical protein